MTDAAHDLKKVPTSVLRSRFLQIAFAMTPTPKEM